jgi:iron complex outermembrane receptor protein
MRRHARPAFCSSPFFTPAVAAAALCAMSAASAQRPVPRSGAAAEPDPDLPVIIVTPEWRPVDLQSVPKTINHFSAQALDAAGIGNTIDLQNAVPGFSFKTNSVLGQPYLRGVGSDFISAGAESSVATFVDGVYLPRAFDSIVDLFDIDRVEVIKGPQSVHLGRNVVGGAVSIHTVNPGEDGGSYVNVTLGDYRQRRVRAASELLPAGGRVAVRVAGAAAKRDGYTHNVLYGTRENGEDFYALRAKLKYEPNERIDVLLASERHSEDSTRATGTKPIPGLGVNGGIALGGYVPGAPREIAEDVQPFILVNGERHSARITWAHGAFDLLASTAYVSTDVALQLDLDSTDAAFASNHPSGTSRAWLQELRVTSPAAGALSWTAGTFLLDERANQTLDVRLPQTATRTVTDSDVDTRSYALFGDVGYRFNERWRGRLGVRYTMDARALDLTRTVSSPANPPVLRQTEHGRWSGTTPELGIEYAANAERLWYGSIARGYKAGGFNTSSIQAAFAPEFLVSYEAGVKTELAEGRARVNAALFHYDYDDLQLNTPPREAPVGTFPRVINAARASIRGADLDVTFRPGGRNLTLALGATLLDARFEDFVSVDTNNPADDPSRAGKRIAQAPDITANVRASYAWPLASGALTFTGEYRRQSDVWFTIYEDPALREPGVGVLNAALRFDHAQGRWYGELVGRNLTDELYAQTRLRNDPLGGTKVLHAAPRTFAVTAGYRW